jgi:hypothetical protein
MAQQTAVEWLVEQMKKDSYQILFGKLNASIETIEQAKAMEKEQIIKAACYEPFLGDFPRKEGEHYYNKIYTK